MILEKKTITKEGFQPVTIAIFFLKFKDKIISISIDLISEFVGMKVLTKESPSLIKDQKNKLEVKSPNLFVEMLISRTFKVIFRIEKMYS